MIKLKCVSGNEKLFLVNSLGIKFRDGVVFDIEDNDINDPEIKALLNMGIIETDQKSLNKEIKEQIKEDMVTFKCTLPLGKRMTIDSIKGTVSGQCVISVPSSSSKNNDIKIAINSGYLIEVVDQDDIEKSNKISKNNTQPKELPEIIKDMYADEKGRDKSDIFIDTSSDKNKNNNTILDLDEVTIDQVKESEKSREEPPLSRLSESNKEKIEKLGLEIYQEEAPEKKKRGRTKKAESAVDAEKPKRGRGRPKKSEIKEESNQNTSRKRGRPKKSETEKASAGTDPGKKRGRGRPRKTEETKSKATEAPKKGRGRPRKVK